MVLKAVTIKPKIVQSLAKVLVLVFAAPNRKTPLPFLRLTSVSHWQGSALGLLYEVQCYTYT
jgi:hypothetical protein